MVSFKSTFQCFMSLQLTFLYTFDSKDEHRTDEGYHSNGGQDELTPPEDSSEDSDSENNYVLDFSVKGTSTKVLVEQKKEELEVS